MTKRVLVLISIILMLIISNSKNPIKIRLLILLSVSIIFSVLRTNTGNVWFPLLFFVLFTGGILIIFIILSSILPNEKALKRKMPKILIIWIIVWSLIERKKEIFFPRDHNIIKGTLTSGIIFPFITLTILIYFFRSIRFNNREEYSIRSFQCS